MQACGAAGMCVLLKQGCEQIVADVRGRPGQALPQLHRQCQPPLAAQRLEGVVIDQPGRAIDDQHQMIAIAGLRVSFPGCHKRPLHDIQPTAKRIHVEIQIPAQRQHPLRKVMPVHITGRSVTPQVAGAGVHGDRLRAARRAPQAAAPSTMAADPYHMARSPWPAPSSP